MTSPLIVVAWDSTEPSLLQRGIEEGWLPALRELRERGRAFGIRGSHESYPGGAWAGTITGYEIPDHGLYVDKQVLPGTYRMTQMTQRALARSPFWRWISEAAIPSVVVSAYGAALVPDFLGVQILAWGSHDPYTNADGPLIGTPKEWLHRLTREIGRRRLLLRKIPETPEELRQLRDRSVRGVGDQTDGQLLLMREAEWDFFWAGFAESHQAGHFLWHTVDPEAPEHGALPEDLHGALADIYRAMDEGLGRIVGEAPSAARIAIVSPHGMGQHTVAGDPLAAILERGGWLTRRPQLRGTGHPGLGRAAWRLGRKLTSRRLRTFLGRFLPRDRWYLSLLYADVDWAGTRAFPVTPDALSYLRINVRGREPEGVVDPAEVDAVCDEIAEALEELVDPDTGRPAVEYVERGRERFGDVGAEFIPELGVQWATTRATRRLRSDRLGVIEIPVDDPRTGMHRLPGFLVVAGPGIAPDGALSMLGPEVSYLDVAPTVLRMLGVDGPPDLRGRAIPDLTG